MSVFEFATAGRIVFGAGVVGRLGAFARELGTRALVVTGRSRSRADRALEELDRSGIPAEVLCIGGEPSVADVRAGLELAQRWEADLLIGIGGGSALDAGKAIAALLTNGGDPLDYAEVVGRGQPLREPSAPYIAVPTTAGTGAEVTRNAVLDVPEHRVKVSLRSPLMLPRIALVDPELTISVNPEVTASTGFDALAQVLEPYVSNQANPLTDALCLEGLRRSARSLRRAHADGSDLTARTDLAITSLCGGLALANAKLGAVHGFAGPLGGMYGAPHGALCAALLPQVVAVNLEALRERAPHATALSRYAEIARILTQDPTAPPDAAVAALRQWARQLGIPGLSRYGVGTQDFDIIAEKAESASSMAGNPVRLTRPELRAVLETSL